MRLLSRIALLLAMHLSIGPACAYAASLHTKAGSQINRPVAQVDPDASLATQLESMFSLASSNPSLAHEMLEGLLADPRFAEQDHAVRHDAHSLSTWLAIEKGDYAKALASARLRAAADPEVWQDWYPLATLEYEAGNLEASAKAIAHLARAWPAHKDEIGLGFVSQLVYQSNLSRPARLELLQALTHAEWMQDRSAGSSLWYELALMQLLDGNVEEARESAKRVSSPESIINLRSDRQFDRLIDRSAPQFDVGLAAKKQVETLQQLASDKPGSLELRNELNDAMLTAGMTKAALHHADLILSKMAQMAEDEALFMDMEAMIWTMNNRAVALRRLGRPEEAIVQLEAASRLQEVGGANVSQILNLSQLYASMGQPERAQATLMRLGDSLSPYGKMVQASTEHRIAVQTHDAGAAAKAMGYLHDNRRTSYSLYLWALLETQQLDQAAELLKGLLATADDRTEALGWAQQSIEIPPQAADVIPEANFKALLARPDVMSAIAKVGHIERYPIFVGYMNN